MKRQREELRKGRKKMNIMATSTTPGEPIGLFHSSTQDISPAAERDPAAKNLGLPGRGRCLEPSTRSLNMEAPQAHPRKSSLEGGAAYDGHRDLFPRPSCAPGVHTWQGRRECGNSGHGRRCSLRSRDDSGGRRQRAGRARNRPRHQWESCQGCWETSPRTRTTVSEPGTVGLRDKPDPSFVVGVPRRTVLQNGRRVFADSELDDDPFSDNADSAAR